MGSHFQNLKSFYQVIFFHRGTLPHRCVEPLSLVMTGMTSLRSALRLKEAKFCIVTPCAKKGLAVTFLTQRQLFSKGTQCFKKLKKWDSGKPYWFCQTFFLNFCNATLASYVTIAAQDLLEFSTAEPFGSLAPTLKRSCIIYQHKMIGLGLFNDVSSILSSINTLQADLTMALFFYF